MKTYYVGMDVHKSTIVIAVLDANGKVVSQAIIETSTQAVRDFLKNLRGEVHITFEEGNHAAWLYDVVKPLVKRLVVCNPKHNHLLKQGSKNDRIDARKLAELLRLKALKPVYHGEHGTRTLKELVRCYECLVKDLSRVQNRLKALYNSQAIRNRGRELYHLKRAARKAMIAESRRHEAQQVLLQVPELGLVRVAQIIATVDSPFRFRTKRPFWAYLGLAVETRSSADHELTNGRVSRRRLKIETRGLNEDYNRRLKSVFKSAATHACSCGVYKEYYEKLVAGGMRSEMARLSVARKLAAAVLAVWKKGESFDEKMIMSRAA